jgi:aminoglycoside 6'-N-acetyltransferase
MMATATNDERASTMTEAGIGMSGRREQAVTVGLRPMRLDELPLLARWLAEPHVARWWREPADLPSVESRYAPAIDGEDPTELLIVELDGRPIGMLQCYLLADNPSYLEALAPAGATSTGASIDYLIGEHTLVGHGFGSQLIAHACERIWGGSPQVTRVLVAVQQENRASWRALEKAGFDRVWSGTVDSGDPADEGPGHVYALNRPR